MPAKGGSREAYFPAIEKKYGEPMKRWHAVMAALKGMKYPEQMAHLQENYGFTRVHANALVMFSRGSTTAKRYATPSDFYKGVTPEQARTIRTIFRIIRAKHPALELVIAWNQPMLRKGTSYILGASATKGYILVNPFSASVIAQLAPKLGDLRVLKRTIALPSNWRVDEKLVLAMAKLRLAEVE